MMSQSKLKRSTNINKFMVPSLEQNLEASGKLMCGLFVNVCVKLDKARGHISIRRDFVDDPIRRTCGNRPVDRFDAAGSRF